VINELSVRRPPDRCPGSERRSTARHIQSKRTEFVCPSSTRPLSPARSGARRPDRFSLKEQNSSVRRQPSHSRWLGAALDGQTDSVKKNRIRLSVVHPSAVAGSERRPAAATIHHHTNHHHYHRLPLPLRTTTTTSLSP
jgi:hypothetical protein